MAMEVRSPAFAAGDTVPKDYTCEGENRSPPLEWSGVPEAAAALMLTCDDPDAPSGLFRHWAAYDIDPGLAGLAAGAAASADFPRRSTISGRRAMAAPARPRVMARIATGSGFRR